MKIGVIDYGMGNLFSVEQALKRLDCEVIVTSDQAELEAADALCITRCWCISRRDETFRRKQG